MNSKKCCNKGNKKGKHRKLYSNIKDKHVLYKPKNKYSSQKRLEKQLEFIIEIDKLKSIFRRSYIADKSKLENDAEHSWHLALMAIILSEHVKFKKLDILRVIEMVLIHDLVEIDAGDTYAYDKKAHIDKYEREQKAADRIFNILPKDQAKEIMKLWQEFESKKTKEAKFATMLDRMQPILLNYSADGKAWKEHNITNQMVLKRNKDIKKASKLIWKQIEKIIYQATEKGYLINDKEKENLYQQVNTIVKETQERTNKQDNYFNVVGQFIVDIYNIEQQLTDNYFTKNTVEDIKKLNQQLYSDILGENYTNSYANPEYCTKELGKELGSIFTLLYAEIRGCIGDAFEHNQYNIYLYIKLFVDCYNIIKGDKLNKYDELIDVVKTFYRNNIGYFEEEFVKEVFIFDENNFGNEILKSDLSDIRYLFKYGEYISEDNIAIAKYLNELPQSTIELMASTYTEAYIRGCKANNIDISKKTTISTWYFIGFERVIKESIKLFKEKYGLDTILFRNGNRSYNRSRSRKQGFYGTSVNKQFEYDHRFDVALYLDEKFIELRAKAYKNGMEKYKNQLKGVIGPALIEVFGEEPFSPCNNENAIQLFEEQQELDTNFINQKRIIQNEYMPYEYHSFVIIAFPIPKIGEQFEEIFKDTIKLNTLDNELYTTIQSSIIDNLDKCEYVEIKGTNGNETDIIVHIYEINDSSKETKFENCTADVNVPVGEVFTSPVLKETNGVLHVKEVFLDNFKYKNLKLVFKDGYIDNYSCTNFDNEKDNKKFIKQNLMYNHQTLPLGEFAIGTNTTAYVMAKKYNIFDILPILIVEKMGPHFAVGDTCYSRQEDNKVYNPNGKEIVARDNEKSVLRKTNIEKAYLNCHTDITIPYDSIGNITGITKNGDRIDIIIDGRFVLKGTEKLNEVFN